jgi:hypothetical protein
MYDLPIMNGWIILDSLIMTIKWPWKGIGYQLIKLNLVDLNLFTLFTLQQSQL